MFYNHALPVTTVDSYNELYYKVVKRTLKGTVIMFSRVWKFIPRCTCETNNSAATAAPLKSVGPTLFVVVHKTLIFSLLNYFKPPALKIIRILKCKVLKNKDFGIIRFKK